MDIYSFFGWCLVMVFAVTLLWPVNTLFAALAYKVRQGPQPISMEPGEFWFRCTFAALGAAGISVVTLGLLYALTKMVQMPAGPVQLLLLIVYLAAAIGYFFWMFALEDIVQASSVFFLYVLLPGLPLLLIGRLFHWWDRVREFAPWLLSPS